MGELKVYQRSTWKKKVRTEQGANPRKSSEVASDKVNGDHKDKPVMVTSFFNCSIAQFGLEKKTS